MANKRKKSTGFGELLKAQKQPKASKNKRPSPVQSPTFLDNAAEENLISMPEETVAYLNELKARKMGLEEFRQEFGEELDIIELTTGSIHSSETDHYKGQVIEIRYSAESRSSMFPMPDADAPIPEEIFDQTAQAPNSTWGKVFLRHIDQVKQYENNWTAIAHFLALKISPHVVPVE